MIRINTNTGQLTVIKTDDDFDRVIIDGKNVGNTEKGYAKGVWEKKGLPTNEVSITYGENADKSKVSDYTTSVVVDVMNESKNSSIQINSTARTPEDQVRIMVENVDSKGMVSQKKLYGSNGDKVLDQYPDKEAMVNKINELGPSNVSRHIADPSKMNVIDVSPWRAGIKSPRQFAKSAQNHKGVSRVLSPYNSKDPAIHVEIPQPKKND